MNKSKTTYICINILIGATNVIEFVDEDAVCIVKPVGPVRLFHALHDVVIVTSVALALVHTYQISFSNYVLCQFVQI